MKWFWGLVASLIVSVASGVGVYVFQDKAKGVLLGEGVYAQLSAGPWYPYYGVNGKAVVPGSGDTRVDQLVRSEAEVHSVLFGDDEDRAARLIIKNKSPKTIKSMKMDIRDLVVGVDIVVVRDDPKGKDLFIHDPKIIDLGSIGPGDKKVVYLWSGADFSNPFSVKDVKLYIDGESIKIASYGYSRIYEDKFINKVLYFIFIAGGFLIFILIAMLSSFLKYTKKLLKDGRFYGFESTRYVLDPKKFSPDME